MIKLLVLNFQFLFLYFFSLQRSSVLSIISMMIMILIKIIIKVICYIFSVSVFVFFQSLEKFCFINNIIDDRDINKIIKVICY